MRDQEEQLSQLQQGILREIEALVAEAICQFCQLVSIGKHDRTICCNWNYVQCIAAFTLAKLSLHLSIAGSYCIYCIITYHTVTTNYTSLQGCSRRSSWKSLASGDRTERKPDMLLDNARRETGVFMQPQRRFFQMWLLVAKDVGSSVTNDCHVHSFPFVLLAKCLWFGMNSEELPDSRALRKKLEIDREEVIKQISTHDQQQHLRGEQQQRTIDRLGGQLQALLDLLDQIRSKPVMTIGGRKDLQNEAFSNFA